MTTGTPHGGSNSSLSILGQILSGCDENSDAVRDLRRSYFYSGEPGVFLFGGYEDEEVMDDSIFGFYDYDVNCDGNVGNYIVGLNQKDLYIDLDFACVIGNYGINGSDGIVGLAEAQLKNYYVGLSSETFNINVFHTTLPEISKTNFEATDEPDYYDLSYKVKTNEIYNGFITAQAPDGPAVTDYDNFVFTTTQHGWVTVSVGNASTFPFGVSILRHPNYDYIFDKKYQSQSFQTTPIQVAAGTYYLELYANPTTNSWQYPYNFKVNWSASFPTSTDEQHTPLNVSVSPNPVRDWATAQVATGAYIKQGRLTLQNQFGQVLQTLDFEGTDVRQSLDLSGLPEGIYFVTVSAHGLTRTEKLVKQ